MISLASGVVVHTYINSYSSHCLSLERLTSSPFASTLSHLRHHRPSSGNPNFYINPLHLPLLLFLFLFLVVSPWANLWIHPSLSHQDSMWESRKGLQAPISFAPHFYLWPNIHRFYRSIPLLYLYQPIKQWRYWQLTYLSLTNFELRRSQV